MKKIILFAVVLFAGVSVIKAQSKSDLTVRLNPIQSISVTTNDGALIEYATSADYSGDGVNSTGNTTINVVSAGGYTVRVSADEFTTTNGGTLDVGTINVTATAQSGATGIPQATTLVKAEAASPLGGNTLIVGETGGVDMKYNISFKGAGDNKYMSVYNAANNNEVQVYETTVYYTIAAN